MTRQSRRLCVVDHREERRSVLGRPGSDLLFQALRLSTIGAEGFNGRVRYGNGFRPLARTTRPAKNRFANWLSFISGSIGPDVILLRMARTMGMGNENDQDRTSY